MSDVQRKLVALPAFKRNQTMQKSLRGLGYDHWIATAGKRRTVVPGKQHEDIVEYGFFVPNARVAKNPAGKELKDRLRPFKSSAALNNETVGSLLNEYRELKAGRECMKAKMETGRRLLREAGERLGLSLEHSGWEAAHGPDPKSVGQHPSPEECNQWLESNAGIRKRMEE